MRTPSFIRPFTEDEQDQIQAGLRSSLSAQAKSLAEPKWVHSKRAVAEPNDLLFSKQLAERICAYFKCSYEPRQVIPEKVA